MHEYIKIGLDLSYTSTGVTVQIPTSTGYRYDFYNIVPKKSKHSCNVTQIIYNRVVQPDNATYTQIDGTKILSAYNQTTIIKHIITKYNQPTIVNVEGNVFTAGKGAGQRAIDLTMLNTIVKLELTKLEQVKELYVFAPTYIKKQFTGSGRAKKEDMIKQFSTIYPEFDLTGKCDDVIDSYAICQCDGSKQLPVPKKSKKKKK